MGAQGATLALASLVLLLAGLGYVVGVYNRLVTLRARAKNAFAQIEVQLRRRYDLIPNLVETTRGYLSHERETLEAVTEARRQAVLNLDTLRESPTPNMAHLSKIEGALTNALSRLSVVVESYPDLKADRRMGQLFEELTSTENKIAFARQAYNDGVTEYNTYKHRVPQVFIASATGFSNDEQLLMFEEVELLRAPPRVAF